MRIADLDPRSSILKEVFMARRSFSAGSIKFLSFILTIALGVSALSFGTRSETSDQATVWTPELSMKVRAVGGVQVSPDGKRVLYTVNDPVMTAEKSEYLTQIWMASADGGDAYQMTFGEKPSTNPDWSPDGRWIAFTSSRSGKNNLYLMRSTGGEAEMITDVKSDVGGLEWSPDGKWIAFTAQRGGGQFDICYIPAQGGVARVVAEGEDPSWAPNSRAVICARGPDHQKVLSLLDVSTKAHKDIARILESNSQPSWAP
jgi:Tol biopolymer transport system component